MTLISRHVSIESGAQVMALHNMEYEAHIPPSVNRILVRKRIRFETVAEYDAQITPRFNRGRYPGQ